MKSEEKKHHVTHHCASDADVPATPAPYFTATGTATWDGERELVPTGIVIVPRFTKNGADFLETPELTEPQASDLINTLLNVRAKHGQTYEFTQHDVEAAVRHVKTDQYA
jgi:hypothetical protein